MQLNSNVRRLLGLFGGALVFLVCLAFAEKKQNHKICRKITVWVSDAAADTYFINETDVLELVTNHNAVPVVGASHKNINLKNLELRLKTNKFIQNCQISRNLNGDLFIDITQRRPIARVIQRGAPGMYVSEEGDLLPLSERFTARVMLVETENPQWLTQSDLRQNGQSQSFLKMLQFIDGDLFWKAQIAHVFVHRDGRISLYPQVGRQVIEFGGPENPEDKFRRLAVFYKQILPAKGWNRYARVNVEYENQIVCE